MLFYCAHSDFPPPQRFCPQPGLPDSFAENADSRCDNQACAQQKNGAKPFPSRKFVPALRQRGPIKAARVPAPVGCPKEIASHQTHNWHQGRGLMGGGVNPHKKQQARQRKIHGAPQSLHHESSAAVKANSFKTIQSKTRRTRAAVVGFAAWTITDDGTGWVIVTAHSNH